jgi:hypothetical protein
MVEGSPLRIRWWCLEHSSVRVMQGLRFIWWRRGMAGGSIFIPLGPETANESRWDHTRPCFHREFVAEPDQKGPLGSESRRTNPHAKRLAVSAHLSSMACIQGVSSSWETEREARVAATIRVWGVIVPDHALTPRCSDGRATWGRPVGSAGRRQNPQLGCAVIETLLGRREENWPKSRTPCLFLLFFFHFLFFFIQVWIPNLVLTSNPGWMHKKYQNGMQGLIILFMFIYYLIYLNKCF